MTNMNTNTTTKANKTTQTIVVRERVVVEAEGKCTHGNRKPVVCWKADGSETRKFASCTDAAKALGVAKHSVYECMAKGKLLKGYKICRMGEMDAYMDEMMTDVSNYQESMRIIMKHNLKMETENNIRTRNASKPVVCIETRQVFASVKNAAIHLKLNYAGITNVLCGITSTCHGMHFCYLLQYEETIHKLEEERIETERKAEEERLEAICKAEEKKRKEEEKRQREIEKLEAKLKRRNEISSRLATEYVRSLELAKEMEAELKALREKEVAYDLQNNTH